MQLIRSFLGFGLRSLLVLYGGTSMKKETNHAQRAHSRLGASSAKRWLNCPGSVKLIETCPTPKESPFAAEGTAAHELAEIVFKDTPNAFYYVGKKKINGFEITQEMASHVQEYVDYVRTIKNELKGELLIEQRFQLNEYNPEFFGTCDAVVIQHFGELHVFDFKYGAGVSVDPDENEQAMFYALGALKLGDFTKVVIHICQPRAGGFKTWETTPKRLKDFGKYLKLGALETKKENAPLRAGSHCQFCPASGVCPELHKTAIQAAGTDFQAPALPEVQKLNDKQILKIIENEKLIKSFLDSVKDYALLRLQNGETLPGLKLVRGRSSREWENDHDVANTFGEKIFQKKLMTPAQAEKVLGKKEVAPFVITKEGSIQVALESDKRQALMKASDEFEKLGVSIDDF